MSANGLPVESTLLEKMGEAMRSQAPDGYRIKLIGGVGLCHVILKIPGEIDAEAQPLNLGGDIWVTADARIDDQAYLIKKLRARGQLVPANASDAALILYTYRAFGESFLDHLIGDFSFVIFDKAKNLLIGARDCFGARPFYYYRSKKIFLFASDIDSLLRSNEVSNELDDEAIGDFLLFGSYQSAARTIYKEVKLLPPANKLCIDEKGFRISAYWTPPIVEEIVYGNASDSGDEFLDIFKEAVRDRLRSSSVAVLMSGGMDSTAIAAVAAPIVMAKGGRLKAYTNTCKIALPEDEEGYYANLAASHIGIPVEHHEMGDSALFAEFDSPNLRTAEPIANPYLAFYYRAQEKIVRDGSRVLLSGQWADIVLAPSVNYFASLLRQGRYGRFVSEFFRHMNLTGTARGLGLRASLIGRTRSGQMQAAFPNWLDEDFVRHTDLRSRWEHGLLTSASDVESVLRLPWISRASLDYEALKMARVVRHPFLDRRLLCFLIRLHNFVKHDKSILREAMRGSLPEAVRLRPKTPVSGDQIRVKFEKNNIAISENNRVSRTDGRYIDRIRYENAFRDYLASPSAQTTWPSARMVFPISLNTWLIGHGY